MEENICTKCGEKGCPGPRKCPCKRWNKGADGIWRTSPCTEVSEVCDEEGCPNCDAEWKCDYCTDRFACEICDHWYCESCNDKRRCSRCERELCNNCYEYEYDDYWCSTCLDNHRDELEMEEITEETEQIDLNE